MAGKVGERQALKDTFYAKKFGFFFSCKITGGPWRALSMEVMLPILKILDYYGSSVEIRRRERDCKLGYQLPAVSFVRSQVRKDGGLSLGRDSGDREEECT